jgi:hypothetical protein
MALLESIRRLPARQFRKTWSRRHDEHGCLSLGLFFIDTERGHCNPSRSTICKADRQSHRGYNLDNPNRVKSVFLELHCNRCIDHLVNYSRSNPPTRGPEPRQNHYCQSHVLILHVVLLLHSLLATLNDTCRDTTMKLGGQDMKNVIKTDWVWWASLVSGTRLTNDSVLDPYV